MSDAIEAVRADRVALFEIGGGLAPACRPARDTSPDARAVRDLFAGCWQPVTAMESPN